MDVQRTIRIPKDVNEALKILSEKEETSINKLIIKALRKQYQIQKK